MSSINSSQQSSQKQRPTTPVASPIQSSSSPIRLPETPRRYSEHELNLLNMEHLSPLMLPDAQQLDATHHSDDSMSSDDSNSLTTPNLSTIISAYPSSQRDEIAHSQEINKTLMEIADALLSKDKPTKETKK